MAYWANINQMKYQRSFTLLETIVAIYVLLAGIVGTMNLTQQNIGAVTTMRNQLIASNLAQEGLELVRNQRDSNYVNNAHTGGSIDWFLYIANYNKQLKLDSYGFYQYESGTPTIFTRDITITGSTDRGSGVFDKKITATVKWMEKTESKKVEVIDVLTDHGF